MELPGTAGRGCAHKAVANRHPKNAVDTYFFIDCCLKISPAPLHGGDRERVVIRTLTNGRATRTMERKIIASLSFAEVRFGQ